MPETNQKPRNIRLAVISIIVAVGTVPIGFGKVTGGNQRKNQDQTTNSVIKIN